MAEEDINYKAMYEAVRNELEQARLTIVRMRHARNPLDKLDGDAIRKFVQKNYLVIIASIMILSFLISSMKTFVELKKSFSKGA
jgi:hypothetical protein